MTTTREIINITKGIALGLVLVFGISYVQAAWTGPTQSPPDGNVEAPVNVSSTFQEKEGDLWADSIGTDDGFCIGVDCITSWSSAGGLPSGAVMPFNRSSCPSGWSSFGAGDGRVLIGVGSADGETYSLGDTGGEADVTLTVSQIPSHTHSVNIPWAGGNPNLLGYTKGGKINGQDVTSTATGGGQAHENRPPYVAVLYCEKD
ncbi:MAG: hypothetical protein WDZ90_01900 [Candidatus Paceibacterota bacterium]